MVVVLIITLAFSIGMSLYTHDYTKIIAWGIFVYSYFKARKSGEWFNPYYLFMPTIFSFILYSSEIGGVFMDDLSIRTRLFILFGLSAITMGFSFGKRIKRQPIIIGHLTENFWLIFLIGLLPTAISYMMFGNIASLDGEEMIDAKENFSLPVIGQLAYFLPASIVVACKKNNSKLILLALVFSILAALLTISKTALLLTLVFFIIAISKFNPDITKTKAFRIISRLKFVIIPILIVAMFIYNNNKRHSARHNSDMSYVEMSSSSLWGTSNFAQNMFLNYCYFVQPWSNLNYNIENNHSNGSFGGNSFAQFGKKLGINTHPCKKIQPTFLNTHTFLTDYYLDFGFFFGIIVCFLMGILIYSCYIKFGLSDDPLLISFYILMAYATIMMFFSNHFNNGYLLNYFITFGLVSLFTRQVAK